MTSYDKKVRLLRKINAIDIDLRHTLSSKNKNLITRRFNKYKSILNNLQDFKVKIVNKKTANNLEAVSYKTKLKSGKSKVLIYSPSGNVKIRNGKILKSESLPDGSTYHETIYPAGKDIFKTAKKLFEKKLGKHEYVMISIGGARPFVRTFYDINTLMFYVNNWSPNDEDEDREELITHMSLVKIYNPNHDRTKPNIRGNTNRAKKTKGKIRSSRD